MSRSAIKLHLGFGVAYKNLGLTQSGTVSCTSEDVCVFTRGKHSNALSRWCKIRRPMADSGIRHAVDIEASVIWCQHATMVASAPLHLNDNTVVYSTIADFGIVTPSLRNVWKRLVRLAVGA